MTDVFTPRILGYAATFDGVLQVETVKPERKMTEGITVALLASKGGDIGIMALLAAAPCRNPDCSCYADTIADLNKTGRYPRTEIVPVEVAVVEDNDRRKEST